MKRLRLTTAGESHGPGLTAVLSGMPAGLTIDFAAVAHQMERRMHGHGRGARMKIEADEVELHGGLRGGVTLGSPIALWIANRDFANWERVMSPFANDPERSEKRRLRSPRPGHADLAGGLKYLRRAARSDRNPVVRRRANWLIKKMSAKKTPKRKPKKKSNKKKRRR